MKYRHRNIKGKSSNNLHQKLTSQREDMLAVRYFFVHSNPQELEFWQVPIAKYLQSRVNQHSTQNKEIGRYTDFVYDDFMKQGRPLLFIY
jgi:hypothetical protein